MCSDGHKSHHQQLRPGLSVQSRETTEDAGCLRLFQRHTYDKQDENIQVMSEVDFHFNMEAVVELAEGMTIGGVAQTELAFLSYASVFKELNTTLIIDVKNGCYNRHCDH